MQITQEQLDAVRKEGLVRLTGAGADLVVVRADVLERLQASQYDDSPWTNEEMALLAAEDADALGWDGMDAYQDEHE